MNILNRIGPNMDPCGTPEMIFLTIPRKPLTLTTAYDHSDDTSEIVSKCFDQNHRLLASQSTDHVVDSQRL